MSTPLPPATVSGVAISGRVFLKWTRAAGAASYNVKRSLVNGGPYTTIKNVPASYRYTPSAGPQISFMDHDLTNGVTYYYVVVALDINSVESIPSSQVTLTPLAIPAAPASITATPANLAIDLSWSAPAGAASYKIWRALTSKGPYTLLASQAGTTYHDAGLSNGTSYYYVVSAINASGEGPLTDESTAVPTGSASTMTTARRTSGFAPLAVVFDAVDEITPFAWSSGVAQPSGADFAKWHYAWDFGDGGSGVWATDGRSKNKALGYVAAHVYDAAGTYTATLTITKDDDTVLVYTQTITVSAWSGSDRYVSSSGGNDSNDGLTPGTAWATLTKVFANLATNRQFFFKRGDTFPTSVGNFTLNVAGPGLFRDYGTGALPIIQSTSTVNPLFTVAGNDWRLMNLDLRGPGATDPAGAISLSSSVKIDKTLIYGVFASGWRVAFGNFDSAPIYATPSSETFIAGCTVDTPQINGIFMGGQNLAVIGTTVKNCVTSHLLRIWQGHKAAVSNNVFDNPGDTRFCFKLHARSEAGHPQTQYVYVSYNQYIRGEAYCLTIGPEDFVTGVEIVQDVVVDSEEFIANPNSQVQVFVKIYSQRITVRNCWGDGKDSKYLGFVDVEKNPLIALPDDIAIYNNTFYKGDFQSGNEIYMLQINSSDIGDIIMRNNLLCTPLIAGSGFNFGTCPGLVQDHNLKDNAPGFQDAANRNFHITPGSAAGGAGVQLDYVRKDHDNIARPLAAAPDIGAYQI